MTSDQTDDILHDIGALLRQLEVVGAKFSAFGQQERADRCRVEAEVVRCWIADIEARRDLEPIDVFE